MGIESRSQMSYHCSGNHLKTSLSLFVFLSLPVFCHNPSYVTAYSNFRNDHLSLPRPKIDIFKTSITCMLWCLYMEQPTSDSQTYYSLSSFMRKLHVHLRQLHRMDCDPRVYRSDIYSGASLLNTMYSSCLCRLRERERVCFWLP